MVIPAGTFVSGALFIKKSDVTIFLQPGAVLKASADLKNYPIIPSRYEGFNRNVFASLINCGSRDGTAINNISILGAGTIDGQGSILSDAATKAVGRTARPHGLLIQNCNNVYLCGFTIQNSPTWCIHPVYCNHLTTENVHIKTDGYNVNNADGWDPDSSTDCYIVGSAFWTHDDCIAIKSGADEEGIKIGKPSEGIHITDCVFHKGGGLALGSEMSGGIRQVYVNDCTFESVDRGINIKTRRKRGGVIEDIFIKNISANHFGGWGINLDMHYNNGSLISKQPENATPVFRNMVFESIDIKTVNGPTIIVSGLPESRIKDISFKNIIIEQAKAGVKVDTCTNILFQNVRFNVQAGPLWRFSDTVSMHILPVK